MSETPLTPWIIVEQSWNILAAHCNCMASFGKLIFSDIIYSVISFFLKN